MPSNQLARLAGEYAMAAAPQRFRERVVDARYSWSLADMRPIARGGRSGVRLLIAPANFASQSYYWARAAELLPGVYARSMEFVRPGTRTAVEADVSVPASVGWYSRAWALRQRRAILRGFTHVLYEAELPLLPSLYGDDLRAEVKDLESHGIKVAMVSHGSDIRNPSTHASLHRDSPFREPLGGLTAALEGKTKVNQQILSEFRGPKYVSTPDLLTYVSSAAWLPTLTNPDPWLALEPRVPGDGPPVALHVPSNSALKGTQHIRAAMRKLEGEGLVEYREANAVPYKQMPDLIAGADMVVDQVAMGLYGVASVEAMLAGRITLAQLGDVTREQVRKRTGRQVPIVEVNPDTLYEQAKAIVMNPQKYAWLADAGREYASAVHTAAAAAEVLQPFLLPTSRRG